MGENEMPIMRYKLIGTNMMERPTKGEWVRWDDVKDIPEEFILATITKKPETDGVMNETDSDNKRTRK